MDGQGNLERTWKVRKKSGNLKINGYNTQSSENLLILFKRGKYYILMRITRGPVSVNKHISVLSNYFDVSFKIYYVRLKYIDSIGQVVKLLILRPASMYCTFKPGHIGSLERGVLQMSTKWGALCISIHLGYG